MYVKKMQKMQKKYAIYAEKYIMCNSTSPIPGYSGSIPASPTTTDSCKHFIASQHIRICPVRATAGLRWPAARAAPGGGPATTQLLNSTAPIA